MYKHVTDVILNKMLQSPSYNSVPLKKLSLSERLVTPGIEVKHTLLAILFEDLAYMLMICYVCD